MGAWDVRRQQLRGTSSRATFAIAPVCSAPIGPGEGATTANVVGGLPAALWNRSGGTRPSRIRARHHLAVLNPDRGPVPFAQLAHQ